MRHVDLTLYSKPGCHLCADARTVVDRVAAELAGDVEVAVEEIDILGDPALVAKYGEEIPVVLLDGRMHTYWRVDPTRLTASLLKG